MKNLFLFILVVVVGFLAYFAFTSYINPLLKPSIGRLNVTTSTPSHIYMDGTLIGTTPFYATNLRVGDHTLEVRPDDGSPSWETNTTLTKATLSVINLDIAKEKLFTAGENLYFRIGEKGLSLLTYPTNTTVTIDDKPSVKAPFDKGITAGVHTVTVAKAGYLSRQLVINIEEGYKLNATVYLAADPFEISSKIVSSTRATLFSLFNKDLTLGNDLDQWVDGIKHVQDSLPTSESRFDAAIDPSGKVYVFDQTAWNNKLSSKAQVNVAYLGRKENDTLTDKAQTTWDQIKVQFN